MVSYPKDPKIEEENQETDTLDFSIDTLEELSQKDHKDLMSLLSWEEAGKIINIKI